MEPLLRFITHRPWLVLALVVAVTVGAASQIVDFSSGEPRLRYDPSTTRLFPEDWEDRQFYDWVR